MSDPFHRIMHSAWSDRLYERGVPINSLEEVANYAQEIDLEKGGQTIAFFNPRNHDLCCVLEGVPPDWELNYFYNILKHEARLVDASLGRLAILNGSINGSGSSAYADNGD